MKGEKGGRKGGFDVTTNKVFQGGSLDTKGMNE
jgi:hypothetical protein